MPEWKTVWQDHTGAMRRLRPCGERNARLDFTRLGQNQRISYVELLNLRNGAWVPVEQRGVRIFVPMGGEHA